MPSLIPLRRSSSKKSKTSSPANITPSTQISPTQNPSHSTPSPNANLYKTLSHTTSSSGSPIIGPSASNNPHHQTVIISSSRHSLESHSTPHPPHPHPNRVVSDLGPIQTPRLDSSSSVKSSGGSISGASRLKRAFSSSFTSSGKKRQSVPSTAPTYMDSPTPQPSGGRPAAGLNLNWGGVKGGAGASARGVIILGKASANADKVDAVKQTRRKSSLSTEIDPLSTTTSPTIVSSPKPAVEVHQSATKPKPTSSLPPPLAKTATAPPSTFVSSSTSRPVFTSSIPTPTSPMSTMHKSVVTVGKAYSASGLGLGLPIGSSLDREEGYDDRKADTSRDGKIAFPSSRRQTDSSPIDGLPNPPPRDTSTNSDSSQTGAWWTSPSIKSKKESGASSASGGSAGKATTMMQAGSSPYALGLGKQRTESLGSIALSEMSKGESPTLPTHATHSNSQSGIATHAVYGSHAPISNPNSASATSLLSSIAAGSATPSAAKPTDNARRASNPRSRPGSGRGTGAATGSSSSSGPRSTPASPSVQQQARTPTPTDARDSSPDERPFSPTTPHHRAMSPEYTAPGSGSKIPVPSGGFYAMPGSQGSSHRTRVLSLPRQPSESPSIDANGSRPFGSPSPSSHSATNSPKLSRNASKRVVSYRASRDDPPVAPEGDGTPLEVEQDPRSIVTDDVAAEEGGSGGLGNLLQVVESARDIGEEVTQEQMEADEYGAAEWTGDDAHRELNRLSAVSGATSDEGQAQDHHFVAAPERDARRPVLVNAPISQRRSMSGLIVNAEDGDEVEGTDQGDAGTGSRAEPTTPSPPSRQPRKAMVPLSVRASTPSNAQAPFVKVEDSPSSDTFHEAQAQAIAEYGSHPFPSSLPTPPHSTRKSAWESRSSLPSTGDDQKVESSDNLEAGAIVSHRRASMPVTMTATARRGSQSSFLPRPLQPRYTINLRWLDLPFPSTVSISPISSDSVTASAPSTPSTLDAPTRSRKSSLQWAAHTAIGTARYSLGFVPAAVKPTWLSNIVESDGK